MREIRGVGVYRKTKILIPSNVHYLDIFSMDMYLFIELRADEKKLNGCVKRIFSIYIFPLPESLKFTSMATVFTSAFQTVARHFQKKFI